MNRLPLRFKAQIQRLWKDQQGEAAVSFALVLPVLLLLSCGILEFAVAMMDRQQASESLRLFSRAVAISITTDDLSGIDQDGPTSCTYADANVTCSNGTSISSWEKLREGFQRAQEAGNIVLVFEPTDLAPADADLGTMALVTVQFEDLDYEAKVLPLYDEVIETILFPTISNSLVVGG
jgi:hypothetical protein